MKHLLTILAAVTLLTACERDCPPPPACPAPPADVRPTCPWRVAVPGPAGAPYSFRYFVGGGADYFCEGVAPDTFTVRVPIDALAGVAYRDTAGALQAAFYAPTLADTGRIEPLTLPATRY